MNFQNPGFQNPFPEGLSIFRRRGRGVKDVLAVDKVDTSTVIVAEQLSHVAAVPRGQGRGASGKSFTWPGSDPLGLGAQ